MYPARNLPETPCGRGSYARTGRRPHRRALIRQEAADAPAPDRAAARPGCARSPRPMCGCATAPSTATAGPTGSPGRAALLLIHGIGDSSATWSDLIPALARHHTVIAPDLLGHGGSDRPRADYSVAAYANGMRDLLGVLGIDRVTLVGHSLGGGVAMQFAYQFPERTERLVLVGTGEWAARSTPCCAPCPCRGRPPARRAAAAGHAAVRPAVHRAAAGARHRTRPGRARTARPDRRLARRHRPQRVHPHPARRRGLARTGGDHARPLLPDRGHAGDARLGRPRRRGPRRPGTPRASRDARQPPGDLRGRRTLPLPHRPGPIPRPDRGLRRRTPPARWDGERWRDLLRTSGRDTGARLRDASERSAT
ncbi:alpha/beta fold hydrolase [Streptomyces zhihengii]